MTGLSDWELERRRVTGELRRIARELEELGTSVMFTERRSPLAELGHVVMTVSDYLSIWREA